MNNEEKQIDGALENLYSYLQDRPLECFDRADFKSYPKLLELQRKRDGGNKLALLQLKFVFGLAWVFPFQIRLFLGVKPSLTAGGLAFYAHALVDYSAMDNDPRHLARAREVLENLKALNAGSDEIPAWGFPFDWQSYEFFPANTPIGYTTAVCADAFLAFAKESGDDQALNWAVSACRFFAEKLNHASLENGAIAMSYTPLDNSMVPNSNVLAAAIMAEVDGYCNTTQFAKLVCGITRFVLDRQQPNGSWFYDLDGTRVDHYHTAMTLQGLVRIYLNCPNEKLKPELEDALISGLTFHLEKFWEADRPINTTTPSVRLDIMSPLESMICFHYLEPLKEVIGSDLHKMMCDRWVSTATWTINKFQARDGSFATLYSPIMPLRLHSLRWGDAPMLRALALTKLWLSKQSPTLD